MKLSDAELTAFRDRCHRAALRGYSVAHADIYLAAMVDEAGDVEPPPGVAPGSAAHLAAAATATLAVRSGAKPKAKKAPTPKPAPKPKPAPEPEPEPEVEEEEEEELGYEEWGRDELYAEAQAREIPGRSNMSKEELAEALYADDEEHGE